jgi:hypothetical protein
MLIPQLLLKHRGKFSVNVLARALLNGLSSWSCQLVFAVTPELQTQRLITAMHEAL